MQYSSDIAAQLGEALKQYVEIREEVHGETVEQIFEDQANKLACSSFGDGIQGLYQEAAALAPSEAELRALPAQLNYRIKRDKGRPIFTQYEIRPAKRGKNAGKMTRFRVKNKATGWKLPVGEIDLRITHRRYQAIGWLSGRLSRYVSGSLRSADRAIVFYQGAGDVLSVTIRNPHTNSGEVDARYGYVQIALENRVEDLQRYLARHLDARAERFNHG